MIDTLDYEDIEFTVSKKDFNKIEVKNKSCINVFCFESKLTYPVYTSNQKLKNSMDLLIILDKIKSHYLYIKDFNKFMFNKTKNKSKKYFYKYCLQCFSSERVLVEHKEICLKISGKETVKLKSGFIEFKNYSRQIAAPFKIYADFECILKSVKSNEGFYTERYQEHISCSFSHKLVCVDNKFSKPIFVSRGENADYKFIEAILKEYEYCIKIMKKPFNNNLIMTEKEEENFRLSNKYWICEKLVEDEKVRDHCQITGKYRGAAHWSFNVNLKLTKKIFII